MELSSRHPQTFPEPNWKGADFYPKDSPSRCLVDNCMKATNWDALRHYASALNDDIKCTILPRITNGLYHLVCLLEFENKTRWVVRIQMHKSTQRLAKRLQNEIDAMALIRERTKVPIPRVFGYEIDGNNPTGVAFMLMEFLPGDVAIDADGGYDIGPFPDLGGPFETATAFFDA
ncbi:hypothetical protein IFR05_008082 [Cadophora sp. M221]|nr:hypothetical protein IFR05_008082 [Cadophora sp. M221]